MSALVTVVLAGCGSSTTPSEDRVTSASLGPADGAPWFEEVREEAGIDFVHRSTFTDRYLMPEIMPGGVALLDMDGDGDLDLYLVQSGAVLQPEQERPGNRLYENLGDGTFRDVTEGSGADDRGFGMGVAAGDCDNDGDVDLYVTNLGPDVLLRNDGGGRFADITGDAGIEDHGWGTSAAFVDYDRDGDLDLFVCHYVNWSEDIEISCYNTMSTPDYCSPINYRRPTRDTLFRNDGDGGFTDVTEAAGIDRAFGNGLGVGCGDFSGDGWPDIFVANDKTPDHLWVNQRDGTFTEQAMLAGCAIDQDGVAKAGMGVALGDLDFDGDLDLMVCNLGRESDSMYLNEGGTFIDSTIRAGLGTASRRFTRFGMGWLDFDNDGFLDLYQANGRVAREEVAHGDDPYAEPNMLFRGHGAARFEEVLPRGGTAALLVGNSRAAAFGDLDNDGGMDIVVVNINAPPNVLRNVVPDRGRSLLLRVLDEHGRDAYGALVQTSVKDRLVTREVRSAYSYLAANDPRVHVSLGTAALARNVTVQWIDGRRETFGDLAADQIVSLRRGEGAVVD